MALFFADLVREASWGTGTGDLPLGGVFASASFVDAFRFVGPGQCFCDV